MKKASQRNLHSVQTMLDDLLAAIGPLAFAPPISHVYNPLIYARENHVRYWQRWGAPPKEVILLGMNPGPWGMAQTGVPFGHIPSVRDWIGISGPVEQPETVHPKRPIEGFDCGREEISGRRLWGWARSRFGRPELFFKRFWVANYCPLVFMEAGGRNRTPDKLPKKERDPLFAACDEALRRTVDLIGPRYVIGVGRFAAQRAESALKDMKVHVGQILHPSPANPKANQGWSGMVEAQLAEMGIGI